MKVTVKYRSHLADLTGTACETVEAKTVRCVLRHLKSRFGSDAEKQARAMLVAVNGESIIRLSLFRTELCDGDEVSFLPICGGG